MRIGASLTEKGEATFETKTYESIDSIVQAFLKEVYDPLNKQKVRVQLLRRTETVF